MAKGIERSYIVPTRFIFLMWASFSFETFLDVDLSFLGIYPRTVHGLSGIVLAPLLHGNMPHIVSNTFPMLFLGTVLYLLFDRIARRVFLLSYFLTGILVWIFARPSLHIGASGLIFALASFLIFFGIFRRDFKSILISLVVILIYNGIFYGVLPTSDGTSWESHLFGALVGIALAAFYSRVKKVSS